MSKASPTSRTLQQLRKEGWTAQVVERWNSFAKIRQDLFGVIDIVALKAGVLLGIQVTSGSNHAARVAKARAEPRLAEWLAVPGTRFEVHSWAKQGPRGKRKTWVCRVEELT